VNAGAVARGIANLTLTKKATDVLLMDLRGLTSMADYFVVCSADSDIQVKAIADAVIDGMEAKNIYPWHIESGSANWILLDFVDVVLHVFHRNTRPFYSLEKLWGDAVIKRVADGAASVPVKRKGVQRAPVRRGTGRRPRKPAARGRKG
jgi:ribosome-associated protein